MWTYFIDSNCDIMPQEAAGYGFKMISMPYSIGTEIIYPYVGDYKFEPHEFYEMLRGGVLPSTSAIGEEEYIKYFEPEFADGKDVFYVHFSAAMSATFNNMHTAVEKLKAKYPERRFLEIDTKSITTLDCLICREIGDLLKAGKTPDEIVKWAETEVDHYTMYFFADDLKFFRHSGRVSGLAATMGGLVGIRPIIYMNSEGRMENIGKERGRARAMDKLVSYVEELGADIKGHHFIIGHTDAPELVDEMKGILYEKFGDDLNIEVVQTNPTIGGHCGPDGIGLAFHSKRR